MEQTHLSKTSQIKESIKAQKFTIIITIALLIISYVFVIPKVLEQIKIFQAESAIKSIVSAQINTTKNYQKETFTKLREEEIAKIVQSYVEKEERMVEIMNKVEQELLANIVEQTKKSIILGEHSGVISTTEENQIKRSIMERLLSETPKDDVLTNKILTEQLEIIDGKEGVNTPSSTETGVAATPVIEKYNTKPYTLDLNIVKEDGDILFYDQSKIGFPIDLSITFPSFFSYKVANINVGDAYYDLHQGIDFRTKPYNYIDIKFPEGKTGVVIYAKEDTYGKHLIIENKELKERYEYAHLSDIKVKVGDNISGNQVIATTGNTGAVSTAPHLHYAVYKNGFLTMHDWGADVKKTTILAKLLNETEVNFIKPYIGTRSANILQAVGIYMQLPDDEKNAHSFGEIIKAIDAAEAKGLNSFIDIVADSSFIKENIKATPRQIVVNMVRTVDRFEGYRKNMLIEYFKKWNQTFLFDKSFLSNAIWTANGTPASSVPSSSSTTTNSNTNKKWKFYGLQCKIGDGSHDVRPLAHKYPGVAGWKNNAVSGMSLGSKELEAEFNKAGIKWHVGTARPANEGSHYYGFADLENGLRAKILVLKRSYLNRTIKDALRIWGTDDLPSQPSFDMNRTIGSLNESELIELVYLQIIKESGRPMAEYIFNNVITCSPAK